MDNILPKFQRNWLILNCEKVYILNRVVDHAGVV